MLQNTLDSGPTQVIPKVKPRLKIAFVGGGPSCVAAYLELADRLSCDIREIIIFDPLGVMGSPAFNAETDALITNTSVGVTSIKPKCDYDFLSWIRSNHRDRDYTPESFVPRRFVGDYIRDKFEAARKHLNSIGCTTRIVTSSVYDVMQDTVNQHIIRTETKDYQGFDNVLICTGCAARLLPDSFADHPDAVPNPYPETKLLRATCGAKNILIIGSKLSAIDAALTLLSRLNPPTLTMVSHSGALPSVRDALLVHATQHFDANAITEAAGEDLYKVALRAAIQDLKNAKGSEKNPAAIFASSPTEQLAEDINACEVGGNYWQRSMGSFIDEINELWPLLSIQNQLRFKDKFHNFNSRLISAFPIENARAVHAALVSGQLSILSDNAANCIVPASSRGFEGRGKLLGLHFDKIVNVTGVDTASFGRSTLGKRLQTAGWSLNVHGGLAVNPNTMQMCNKNAGHTGLYAVGAPVAGSVLITNYLRSSVIQAHRAVEHIHHILQNRPRLPLSAVQENSR